MFVLRTSLLAAKVTKTAAEAGSAHFAWNCENRLAVVNKSGI